MKEHKHRERKKGMRIRHGAEIKLCSSEECTNHIVKGGVCTRHEGKVNDLSYI